MADPRFSIAPPDVLAATIDSVLSQGFADWELCLVDDASADPQIGRALEDAERGDPRIRHRRRAENSGIVAASNDALAMARGEFIVLLDLGTGFDQHGQDFSRQRSQNFCHSYSFVD